MRPSSDETYVIDLFDRALTCKGARNHRFHFLVGDKVHKLPVDAYYEPHKLVVEYRERQHSEPVPFFDMKLTVSGMPRGLQRARYDQRRREILPQHGIKLLEIDYSMFAYGNRKRLRRTSQDIEIVRRALGSVGVLPNHALHSDAPRLSQPLRGGKGRASPRRAGKRERWAP